MKLTRYVKFREEKFGGVLFETRAEKVYTLNPVATAVVREIDKGGGAPEIVARLQESFHDPERTLEKEAADFIAFLRAKELIED